MTGAEQAHPINRITQRLAGVRGNKDRWVWTGDTDPEVLVAGQSHRTALLLAYQAGLTPLRASVLVSKDGTRDIDPTYWPTAAVTKPALPIVVAWSGNVAIMEFLFVVSHPFRIIRDGGSEAGDSEMVVPAEAVKDHLGQSNHWAERLRNVLDTLESRQRLVIGTPPPKSAAIISSRLREGTVAYKLMKDQGVDLEHVTLAPVGLRVAIWELLQELLRDIAIEKSAVFVGVPASVQAPDGTLREDLSANDINHGNTRYGGIMWEAVGAALKENAPV